MNESFDANRVVPIRHFTLEQGREAGNRGNRGSQLMRGDREELVPSFNRGSGRSIEASIVDRQGGAPGELFDEAELARSKTTGRQRCDGQYAGRNTACNQRNNDRGLKSHFRNVEPACRRIHPELLRFGFDRFVKHRLPGSKNEARAVIRRRVERPLRAKLKQSSFFSGAPMRNREGLRFSVFAHYVDDAHIGEVHHGQAGDARQCCLEIKRRSKQGRGFCQEPQIVLGFMAIGHIAAIGDDTLDRWIIEQVCRCYFQPAIAAGLMPKPEEDRFAHARRFRDLDERPPEPLSILGMNQEKIVAADHFVRRLSDHALHGRTRIANGSIARDDHDDV